MISEQPDPHTQSVLGDGSSSSTQKLQRKKGGAAVSQHHTLGGPASTSLIPTVDVPGSKAESLTEVGGPALSVYRGHAPSTPIWCVSSAPCGYYFGTAGSDYGTNLDYRSYHMSRLFHISYYILLHYILYINDKRQTKHIYPKCIQISCLHTATVNAPPLLTK